MGDCSTLLCRQEAAQLGWVGSFFQSAHFLTTYLGGVGGFFQKLSVQPFALFIRARGIYNERECASAHLNNLSRKGDII